jgi:hypothetical protein
MWVRLFERRDVSYRAQRSVRHVWLVVRAVKEPTGWLITTALKRSVQSVPTVATSSASRQRQVRWASAASLLAIPPCGRAKAHLHPGHETVVYMLEDDVVTWSGDNVVVGEGVTSWRRRELTLGRFAEHADVAATVEATFDYVTDQAKVAEWNDHVQRVEIIGGGSVAVGSRLRQHRRRGKRDFVLEFEVTAHERPRRHTVEGAVFGVDTTMEFTFEPHDSGSGVTMAATVTGRGLRALMTPIVTREMRKSTVAALDALRAELGTA